MEYASIENLNVAYLEALGKSHDHSGTYNIVNGNRPACVSLHIYISLPMANAIGTSLFLVKNYRTFLLS